MYDNEIAIVNIFEDGIDYRKYTYAVCGCMPVHYAIKIARKNIGYYYRFNCPKCGKELGIVISNKVY